MEDSARIEILLSKTKLTWLLLGSFLFFTIGTLLLANPAFLDLSAFGSPFLTRIIGLSAVVFFGIAGFFIFKKRMDKTPGLVLSEEGAYDNSSAVSVGFIPWSDVVEITETRVLNQLFINLVLKNPQEYIDKQTSLFKRKTLQVNYNAYGTVVGISANSLKINYPQLHDMVTKKFAAYNKK
jgi:hypothetical protein